MLARANDHLHYSENCLVCNIYNGDTNIFILPFFNVSMSDHKIYQPIPTATNAAILFWTVENFEIFL